MRQAGDSWVIEIPDEMARAMGVSEGSLAVLHAARGTIEVEVLPPPSPELDESHTQPSQRRSSSSVFRMFILITAKQHNAWHHPPRRAIELQASRG